ncbi:MAG: hypothetical protein KatS3mg057_0788 [Herpetosiphonaceae bacterium]|nr:MAG: hypothetical protein KatS3mg057_0788 [Herpetosiphonaceae bacterium]
MPDVSIAPSILSADFARLGEQVREAEQGGADWFHVDVMDGHFVPNISLGPLIVAAMRPLTRLPIEVHLMIERPERYLSEFINAGADRVIVHVEASVHLHRAIQAIKELGAQAGVTLNPATPLVMLADILPEVDLAMIMSVNPGFSGQRYIPASTTRVRRLREMLDGIGSPALLSVDGGVTPENAAEIAAAGATALVAASAIFNAGAPIAQNIARLRSAAGRR